MASNPTTAIDDSEGFNYETETDSSPKGSIDLTDKSNNDAITDNIVATRKGILKPYITGKIVWDESVSRYYLSHNTDKSDSIGLGFNPTGNSTGGDSSRWFDNQLEHRLYERRDDQTVDTKLFRDTEWELPASTEVADIQSSFTTDNHNSYAYQIDRHPDFVQAGVPLLDIGMGPGISRLTQQTGVWTTRVINGNCKRRKGLSPYNRRGGFGAALTQQKHPALGFRDQYRDGGVGYNHHGASSFMIRLNAPLEPGEYIPICTYNSIDRSTTDIDLNNSEATGWGIDTIFETQKQAVTHARAGWQDRYYANWNKNPIGWDTVASKISSDTGHSPSQYSDDYLQWYNLTCNTLIDGRRNIHDVIIFIGKPFSNPLVHELVIWYAGGDGVFAPPNGWNDYMYNYFPSSTRKVTISNALLVNEWVPVFFHHMTEKSSSNYGDNGLRGWMSREQWANYNPWVNTSNYGTPIFACMDGIQDYDISQSVHRTSLDIGFQCYGGATDQDPSVREVGSGTFLSYYATDKISIADINYNINNNHYKTGDPTLLPINSVYNPTYFPSATVTYEGTGAASGVSTLTAGSWDNIENIKSSDVAQEATVKALGPENSLQLFINPSTASVIPTSIVKSIAADIRGIRKRFINPNVGLKFALYKNNNNVHPTLDSGSDDQGKLVDERISEITKVVVLNSESSKSVTINITRRPGGGTILYNDLDPVGDGSNRAYFKIWADE